MGKFKVLHLSYLIGSIASFPEKINNVVVHKEKRNNYQQQQQQQQQITEAWQNKKKDEQQQQNELEGLCKQRMDPIYILPIEIINSIFLLLPQEALITCIQVSKLWREQILLDCVDVWRNIIIQDNKQDKQLACVTSFMGVHVKHMSINTTSEKIRFKYLKNLKNGHFTRIQSLKITMLRLQDMEHYIAPMTTSLGKIEDTLTKFTIDVGNAKNPILIADILASCNNLNELTYSTTTVLSTFQTENDNNSSSHSKKLKDYHYSLQNLQIRAPSITGADIVSILKYCSTLRRLVMNDCDPSVLDTIVSQPTPNLEILGYNRSDDSCPVPPLSVKKETATYHRRYYHNNNKKRSKKQKMVGNLRILHIANNSSKPIPARNIIPLLYKNKKSLNYIMACISSITETELEQFYAKYPDFQLHNVTRLVFWPYKGIQELMLHAVRHSTKLSFLHAVNPQDINVVITTLMEMPPLKRLSIKNPVGPSTQITTMTTEVESPPSALYLNNLFKRYARISLSSPTSTATTSLPPSSHLFKSLVLRGCNCITDQELATISNIRTLKRITFQKLVNVSTHGLTTLFTQLNNQLTSVRLAGMKSVTDNILSLIGDMDNLTCIKLEDLKQVTDRGVRILVDKKKANNTIRLMEFFVYKCPLITPDCMIYVKQKIPIAVISAH